MTGETPIQRLQRLLDGDDVTQVLASVTLKNSLAIAGLDDRDDQHDQRLSELERRLDGQAAALRALAIHSPGDVAEAMTRHMLRSVDDE